MSVNTVNGGGQFLSSHPRPLQHLIGINATPCFIYPHTLYSFLSASLCFFLLLSFYFNLMFPLFSVLCWSPCLGLLMASLLIDAPDVLIIKKREKAEWTCWSLQPWLIKMITLLCLIWTWGKNVLHNESGMRYCVQLLIQITLWLVYATSQ